VNTEHGDTFPTVVELSRWRRRLLLALTALTIIGVGFGLMLALTFARTDAIQGDVQRIFYLHMAAFPGALLAFGLTALGSLFYLLTRQARWDTLAHAGVEVGLVLATINLFTGMIWSRPIWNTWWTWEPRLTWEAIMILTYAAYLMFHQSIENIETRRRFASIYGLLAITTAVMTLVIVRLRTDTLFPPAAAQDFLGRALDLSSRASLTLDVNLLVWGVLMPVTLIWHRIRLENLREQVEMLKAWRLS
jgi:heme exporter protein C